MDRVFSRRHVVKGGLTALSLTLVEVLYGCGSGGGGNDSSPVIPNDPTEYRTWLNTTLVEQRKTVGDATANFVDLKTVTETNFTTSLVGWVRRASDSSVDQLWRWSSDPTLAKSLLEGATNRIGLAAQSINLTKSFDLRDETDLGIPILKSVLDFARKKSSIGSITISISSQDASVTWISDLALKSLLESAKFTSEFLDSVALGEVTLYRGAIALRGIKITLKASGTLYKETQINDTFIESGLTLHVTSKSTGTVSGEIVLDVPGELYVGIDSRVLRPGEIGRFVSVETLSAGENTIKHVLDINLTTAQAKSKIWNLSPNKISALSYFVMITTNDVTGNKRYFGSALSTMPIVSSAYSTQDTTFELVYGPKISGLTIEKIETFVITSSPNSSKYRGAFKAKFFLSGWEDRPAVDLMEDECFISDSGHFFFWNHFAGYLGPYGTINADGSYVIYINGVLYEGLVEKTQDDLRIRPADYPYYIKIYSPPRPFDP